VLSGDTAPCDGTAAAAWRADLLVHEATFVEEEGPATRRSTADGPLVTDAIAVAVDVVGTA
jgi:ribonuclease BN (tRNA processing enzyme)